MTDLTECPREGRPSARSLDIDSLYQPRASDELLDLCACQDPSCVDCLLVDLGENGGG